MGQPFGVWLIPLLKVAAPEKAQHIAGADHQRMLYRAGMEIGGILRCHDREFTGIEMVGFQTVGDITDGVKMPDIEIKAKRAENGYGEFCAGKSFAGGLYKG